MSANNYKLQILHHEEVFVTRQEALNYLKRHYSARSVEAEPLMLKYRSVEDSDENPNVILAFGTSDAIGGVLGGYYFIDMRDTEEKIEELNEEIETSLEDVNELKNTMEQVIGSCGLERDMHGYIIYHSDNEIVKNTTSIAEAIDVLAEKIQQQSIDAGLTVQDSKSIKLVYKVNPEGGMMLKAKIKISANGDSDRLTFNNNIIGVKDDGIYGAAHLNYDEDRHELIYTTSGYVNGEFKDDAIVQRVNLGKYAKTVADNDGHSVKLVFTDDPINNLTKLSGDVKISEREDNLIQVEDNTLFASARAKDIKYMNKTVASALTTIEETLETKADKTELDTLEGAIDVKLDTKANKDEVYIEKYSDLEYKLFVNGVVKGVINIAKDQFLKKVVYDESNQELIFVFYIYDNEEYKEETVVVDMKGLIDVYSSGDGLKLEDNVFSVNLGDNEEYLNLNNQRLNFNKTKLEADLNTKADKTDVYTKNEINAALLTKADKTYVDEKLETKADNTQLEQLTNIVTELNNVKADKTYVDGKLETKANTNDVYVKTEIDNKLETKANTNDVYTKNEVYNKDEVYTKEDINAALLTKADKTEALKDIILEEVFTNEDYVYHVRQKTTNDTTTDVGDIKIPYAGDGLKLVKKENEHGYLYNINLDDNEEYLKLTNNRLGFDSDKLNTALNEKANKDEVYTKTECDNKFATKDEVGDITGDITNINNRLDIIDGDENTNGSFRKEIKDKVNKNYIKIEGQDLLYKLFVNNEEAGTINIPKDQFLKEVEYVPESKELVFTFVTTDEDEKIVRVPVGDLVDEYTAGDGLELDENNFSVKIDNQSEEYLTVSENGLKLSGINEELNTIKEDIVELQQEVNSKVDNQEFTTFTVSLAEWQEQVNGRIGDLETEVETIKGELTTLKNNLGDISGEKTVAQRLQEIESVIQTLIDFGYTEERNNN